MTIKGCIVYTYITCHRYADAARESAIEESEYFSSVSPHEESWPCVDDSCDEALYADELKEKVNGNVTWCNFELVDWYRIHLFNRKRSRFTDVIMYKPHTHALINRCHIVHSSLFNVHSQYNCAKVYTFITQSFIQLLVHSIYISLGCFELLQSNVPQNRYPVIGSWRKTTPPTTEE